MVTSVDQDDGSSPNAHSYSRRSADKEVNIHMDSSNIEMSSSPSVSRKSTPRVFTFEDNEGQKHQKERDNNSNTKSPSPIIDPTRREDQNGAESNEPISPVSPKYDIPFIDYSPTNLLPTSSSLTSHTDLVKAHHMMSDDNTNTNHFVPDTIDISKPIKQQKTASKPVMSRRAKSESSFDSSIFRCDTPVIDNTLDSKGNGNGNGKHMESFSIQGHVVKEEKRSHKKSFFSDDEENEKSVQLTPSSSGYNDSQETNGNYSFFCSNNLMDVIYLAVFAIMGASSRSYLARMFGYDCEFPPASKDYVSMFSTCVTASGETNQRGGALFIDLPANMLGSFILGLMTPLSKDIPSIPWLKKDHHFQQNIQMHMSIRTGFCGSLTTFSSWNTQMIIMMVGKGTVLGAQIVPALMGYIIGTSLSISSFLFGRQCASFLYHLRQSKCRDLLNTTNDIESNDQNNGNSTGYSRRHQYNFPKFFTFDFPKFFTFDHKDDENNNDSSNNDGARNKHGIWNRLLKALDIIVYGSYSPILFAVILFGFFVLGDYVMKSQFHKLLWVMSLISPIGAIIRWRLSFLNNKWFQNSNPWKYLPIGTLISNIAACIISILCAALLSRSGTDTEVRTLILNALKIGLAGSMSTVSTFVKEIVHLSENPQSSFLPTLYTVGSIIICCCISLIVYVPIRI